MPFIGNIIISILLFFIFVFLGETCQISSSYLFLTYFVAFYIIKDLYAKWIFSKIHWFNLCKTTDAPSSNERAKIDMTQNDVKISLTQHSKWLIIYVFPTMLLIFILGYFLSFNDLSTIIETIANMPIPEEQTTQALTVGIYFSMYVYFKKVLYVSLVTLPLPFYFATKKMFGKKKIYNQFYLCKKS